MGRRDIYDVDRQIARYMLTLPKWAESKSNQNIIKDFHERLVAENLSPARILIYLQKTKKICNFIPKSFNNWTETDLRKFIFLAKDKKWSDVTVDFHLTTLKKLSRTVPNLEFTRSFKYKVRKKKFSKFMPSEEHVQNMVKAVENTRDKAFISMLYETGFRPGDILSLRKKDIQFDQYGCKLFPDGKTGEYVSRLIDSVHHLSNYLNSKLQNLNDEDYIWLKLTGKDSKEPADWITMNRVIKRAAIKIGVNQPITMYSFRHARTTQLLKEGYPTTFVNKVMGRKANSKEIEAYEHLTFQDIDDVLLSKKGLKKIVQIDNKPKQCARCEYVNPKESKFCNRCSGILDIKTAQEVMESSKKPDDTMNLLMQDQEFKDMFVRKMKQLTPPH